MLVKCPECELQVSDRAVACPHCGYPLQKLTRSYNRPAKRRRLPNGFGQISEIKNRNLRKPFRAMISVGKAPNGRPICKPLKPESYFETYNDAYTALMEYNKNPMTITSDMTMQELYEKWSADYFKDVDLSSIKNHEISWNYCSYVHDMKVQEVRASHIRYCMENGTIINSKNGLKQTPGPKRQQNIKSLFNLILDYAVQYGIVDRNYSREFKVPRNIQKTVEKEKKSHISFTEEELNILKDNIKLIPFIDIILIQCYSGWRPAELCSIRLEDVDLENMTFTGGSKTEAGKNRTVPIHPAIQGFVRTQFERSRRNNLGYLINYINAYGKPTKLRYIQYNKIFASVMEKLQLNPEHKPHDCRKTFVTLAKKYNVDEYAIKRIVGHSIPDITERDYTERDLEWLRTEIEKVR